MLFQKAVRRRLLSGSGDVGMRSFRTGEAPVS